MHSSLTKNQPGSLSEEPASGAELPASPTLPWALGMTGWLTRLSLDTNLKNRLLTHGPMALVALIVIGLSQYNLPWGNFHGIQPLRLTTEKEQALPLPQPRPTELQHALTLSDELQNTLNNIVQRNPVLRTVIPDRTAPAPNLALSLASGEIQPYIVQIGDNISNIAFRFGLEAIRWFGQPGFGVRPGPHFHWTGVNHSAGQMAFTIRWAAAIRGRHCLNL
jgi:hypothetical protein